MEFPAYCESCGRIVLVSQLDEDSAVCPNCSARISATKSGDVFISFSFVDEPTASIVARRLQDAGIHYWLAPESLHVGANFRKAIDRALSAARVLVVLLSPHSIRSHWVLAEMHRAMELKKPILPVRIADFPIPSDVMLIFTQSDMLDLFREPVARQYQRLIVGIEQQLEDDAAGPGGDVEIKSESGAAPRMLLGANPNVSPYVGPEPYASQKADLFFGRSRDARHLLRALQESRAILLYSQSGVGKSSLLNTLIRRSLEHRGNQVFNGVRVGGALPPGCDATSTDVRNVFATAVLYQIGGATPDPRCRIDEYISAMASTQRSTGRVIIFDQFEELFTQHPHRHQDRYDLIADLANTLRTNADVRMILAIRKEFLADLNTLWDAMASEFPIHPIVLQHLEGPRLLKTITGPAANFTTFAPGVAEEIVRQLNILRISTPDGRVVEMRGEFVELVHLQIVCNKLWRSLPPGTTCIEMRHLERAAGEGKSFESYVQNALDDFFLETVDEVAKSSETRRHGGYDRGLIQLGCMKFVGGASTRVPIQQSRGRTGRLPDWIVEQLASKHLLRAEQRGPHRWYELSHDLLVDPVERRRDPMLNNLLFATTLLDTVFERAMEEHGGKLDGYFGRHDEVLGECRPFHAQAGLFPDEAEFLFRLSLASGLDMAEWSSRLAADFPEVRMRVIRDALRSTSVDVRNHVATVLGSAQQDRDFGERLVDLAISDENESVRVSAARSLAYLDEASLFESLRNKVAIPTTSQNAVAAMSRILNLVDEEGRGSRFLQCRSAMQPSARRRIYWLAKWFRLRDGLAATPYFLIPAAFFSALATGIFKWPSGVMGWALCQQQPSVGAGFFHGLVAGLMGGGIVALSLTLHLTLLRRKRDPASSLRPLSALCFGALGGLLGGIAVLFSVIAVYERESLANMGWLIQKRGQFSSEFFKDLFEGTRFGWAYPVIGVALGLSLAMILNSLWSDGTIRDIVEREKGIDGVRQGLRLAWSILRKVIPRIAVLPIFLAGSAIAVYFLIRIPPDAHAWIFAREKQGEIPTSALKTNMSARLLGVIFDSASMLVSGIFVIVGMVFGAVLVSRGTSVRPRKYHLS